MSDESPGLDQQTEHPSRRDLLRYVTTATGLVAGASGAATAEEHEDDERLIHGVPVPDERPDFSLRDREFPWIPIVTYELELLHEDYTGTSALLTARLALPDDLQEEREDVVFHLSAEATTGPTTEHHRAALEDVPETIRFGPDEVEKRTILSWDREVTTEFRLTIDSVEGGPETDVIVQNQPEILRILGPEPVLKDVAVERQDSRVCGGQRGYAFEVVADNFFPSLWPREYGVHVDEIQIVPADGGERRTFQHASDYRTASLEITEIERGPDVPWEDVRVRCEAPGAGEPGGLTPGTYDVAAQAYEFVSRYSNTLESALRLEPPVPEPRIVSLEADPPTAPGINNCRDTEIHWTVQHANRVEVENLEGGRLGREPGEFFQESRASSDRACDALDGYATDCISTTERYEVRAFSPWDDAPDDPVISVLTVPEESDAEPGLRPVGFDQIFVFNCHSTTSAGPGGSDVPPNRYTLWVQERDGSGSALEPWRKLESVRGRGYLDPESGVCPNWRENDYVQFDLEDDAYYAVLVLKTDLAGCGEADPSPSDANCWAVEPFVVPGDSDGDRRVWALPGGL